MAKIYFFLFNFNLKSQKNVYVFLGQPVYRCHTDTDTDIKDTDKDTYTGLIILTNTRQVILLILIWLRDSDTAMV